MSVDTSALRRKNAQAPLKMTPCIGGCGRQVGYRTSNRVYCPECKATNYREMQRRAAERKRRKKGIAPVKGTVVKCAECNKKFVRNGIKRLYCDKCIPFVHLRRAREKVDAKSRARGALRLTDPRPCSNCDEPFAPMHRGQARRTLCAKCQEKKYPPSLPPNTKCADCPNPLPTRSGPGGRKLLCDDCAAERRRRKDLAGYYKRQGRVPDFSAGSITTCLTCPATFVKTRSDHVYCEVCLRQRLNDSVRPRREAARRAAGVPLRSGVEILCANPRCGRPFVRKATNGKFCDQCPHASSVINHRNRRKTDPAFKLRTDFGASIRKSLLRGKAGAKWESVVGYTLQDLMRRLVGLFLPGMTWENRGAWHIDHIRPLWTFKFTCVEDPEFKEAWRLENLQPLWKAANLEKGGKWNGASDADGSAQAVDQL